jgi:hypothetical protein
MSITPPADQAMPDIKHDHQELVDLPNAEEPASEYVIDTLAEKRLLRKIDRRMLPMLWVSKCNSIDVDARLL